MVSVEVLPPCGICQERLAMWGPQVEVGVPDTLAPAGWRALTLAEVNPHYWGPQFTDGAWPSARMHAG
ncbi:hypothetical protein N566_15935 [Streptomycetaceae bacterium MP113-05]|nr:hypothetical protein N566_15935 [Streptomycetaceae bacterium MP113-05]